MLISNTAEGGSDGTTVTTGNSGGASGNAWNTVNIGGTSTLTYSNTQVMHGTLAYSLVTGATGGAGDIGFTTWSTAITSPGTTMYLRGYYYFAGTTVSIFRFAQFLDNGFLSCGGIGTTAASKFKLLNATGALVSTSTTTVPANQWIRLEFMTFSSATVGQMELKIYLDPSSSTPDETLTTAATQNTRGGNITATAFGADVAIANLSLYMDSLAVQDTGYIGPVPVYAAPWFTA